MAMQMELLFRERTTRNDPDGLDRSIFRQEPAAHEQLEGEGEKTL